MSKMKKIIIFSSLFIFLAIIIVMMIVRKNDQKEGDLIQTQTVPVADNFEKIYLKEKENEQEIKENFKEYVQKELVANEVEKGYSQAQIVTPSGEVVGLEMFSQAMEIKINRNIKNILNQNDFALVKCQSENGRNMQGIILNVKLFKSFPNLYEREKEWMREWERTILGDLHQILFPGIVFGESYLNKPLQFRDGKYRYAEVELPDGTRSSINYNIVFDSIIITTSLPCLEKISVDYETLEP